MAATPATMLAIVSHGLQDRERLNTPVGQPSVRFYSKVFRRRTRWASWWRRVDFDAQPAFGKRTTVTIPIIGELITRATLVVELPDLVGPQTAALAAGAVAPFWSWTNDLGHALCRSMDFTINGYPIVSLDSRRMAILDEQTQPVEHFTSTNMMIGRNPSDFEANPFAPLGQTAVLEIVPPFWWNRGPGPQALPIQALAKDKVQIVVDFRGIQECVYTSGRSIITGEVMDVSDVTTPSTCNALPTIGGAGFVDGSGAPVPGQTMPTAWSFVDAFWVVEYVSLEDREAAAFRMADLEIPIEQHVALQPQDTGGVKQIRIPIETGGLVRDMTWVAQRTEAPDYNAYFLYSRDLNVEGEDGVWWPNAQIPNWDYWTGSVRPAFADRRSDPLVAAQFLVRHKERFNHEGAALFRSVIPALGSRRGPLVDRYIYRYDFGLWPTGGLAEALERPLDEFRGAANWDLLNNKELVLTLDTSTKCQLPIWQRLTAQQRIFPANTIAFLETYFPANTEAFHVALYGGSPGHPDQGGEGALVEGVVDFQTLQRTPNYVNTIVRTNTKGSASLVMETRKTGEDSRFTWIAVAGGGGYGPQGGYAASAVDIGQRGGGSYLTHEADANYGGGGGGRGPTADVGQGAFGSPGPTDGTQMLTTSFDFVYSHQTTGGNGVSPAQAGGDGYYGGGGGVLAGGGGGSYVSRYISEVFSQAGEGAADSYVVVTPLRRIPATPPSFNIYIWLTRINMLRITGGHGVLLFSA